MQRKTSADGYERNRAAAYNEQGSSQAIWYMFPYFFRFCTFSGTIEGDVWFLLKGRDVCGNDDDGAHDTEEGSSPCG